MNNARTRNPRRIRWIALGALGTLVVAGAAGATYVLTGSVDVAADEPHSALVASTLELARERAIHARIDGLAVPADLDDPARVLQGAGNYDAMCVQCHLAPGTGPTELSRGLNPAPPDLTREEVDAAEAFWVIKHGIRMTGMPAWGDSMADGYVWNLAAFVRQLPKLDEAQYRDLVARSGGHSHGGGETGGHGHGAADAQGDHPHPPGTPADHHGEAAAGTAKPGLGAARAGDAHAHPPGTPVDHHGKAAAGTTAQDHADGNDHGHAADAAPAPAQEAPAPGPAARAPAPAPDAAGREDTPAAHDHADHQH